MSPKRPTETPKEIARRLLADGWTGRPGRGDHMVFRKPGSHTLVTVDMGRREIPIGTLRSIYRQAGWTW